MEGFCNYSPQHSHFTQLWMSISQLPEVSVVADVCCLPLSVPLLGQCILSAAAMQPTKPIFKCDSFCTSRIIFNYNH